MADYAKLIVGLANPGPEYQNTRHNAGEWYIQQIADLYRTSLTPDSKFFGLTGRVTIQGRDVRLLVPTTYMNRSGQAVAALANFYRIEPEEILVAHDELAIEPGIAKFKRGGGHAGHNGLRDIISKLGNNKNFMRLRIGIGHPGDKNKVSGYVLGKAPQTDQQKIDASIDEAVRCSEIWYQQDLAKAMNRLHSFQA